MRDTLAALSGLDGVGGHEKTVRAYINEAVKPFAEETREDVLGNLFVRVKGEKTPRRSIVLAAPMDEYGFVAGRVEESGAISFGARMDNMDPKALIGKRFRVEITEENREKPVRGVISVVAQHLTGKAGTDETPELKDLTLDVGAKNKDGGAAAVKEGDGIVFDYPFSDFGEGFYRGKAVDARLGAAVLLKLIRDVKPLYDAWFLFTAYSKIEHRGALVAARALDPAVALVVDAAAAGDVPIQDKELASCYVGRGAVLGLKEYGTIYSRSLREAIAKAAAGKGIKVQYRSGMRGETDAGNLHTAASGAKIAGLGAAVRYAGTGNPIVHRDDLAAVYETAKLLLNGGFLNELV